MKIAVSAQGQDKSSPVDPRFGRCGYFIIVDTVSGDIEVVDNGSISSMSGGAGIQAAQQIADKGAEAVVTGHCGPKAFTALEAAGIGIYPFENGTVEEAVKAFTDNKLTPLNNPDVQGHWA